MMKHWVEDHQNEDRPRFSMKVLRGHTSAFVRQIHEAVLIEMHAGNVLNSKGEFNRCQLPRLGVKMGEKSVSDKEPEKEMTEKDIFYSVQMDRKRKEKRQENTGPASKRKKCHIRRPEFKSAPKRMRSSISEELETQTVQKKARKSFSKSRRECLLPKIPKILISCEADSKSSQVRQTKTFLKSSDENLKNARNIYPIFTVTKSTQVQRSQQNQK